MKCECEIETKLTRHMVKLPADHYSNTAWMDSHWGVYRADVHEVEAPIYIMNTNFSSEL